jgi:hypothetical protein
VFAASCLVNTALFGRKIASELKIAARRNPLYAQLTGHSYPYLSHDCVDFFAKGAIRLI